MRTHSVKSIVSDSLENRSGLIKLFLITVILAFSINTLSNLLTLLFTSPTRFSYCLLTLGMGLFCTAILWLIYPVYSPKSTIKEFNSVIVFDNISHEIIRIPDYEFSEILRRTQKAMCIENEPWKSAYLKTCCPGWDHNTEKKIRSSREINELIEFVLLEWLSLHLSEYFNNSDSRKLGLVRDYLREDIPELLLKNRVLSLLTTPPQDRKPFMDMAHYPEEGEIVTIVAGEGYRYDKFELKLPYKCQVYRSSDGKLTIDSARLRLSFRCEYSGFGAVIDHELLQYYANCDFQKVDVRKLDVRVEVQIKNGVLFNIKYWELYHWVDSFINNLTIKLSFDTFLEDINWPTVKAILRSMDISKSKSSLNKDRSSKQANT
jgi:hypothetical protein